MKTEKCKPVKRNETITHDLNSCCCLPMVNGTHTHDKEEKTIQHTTTKSQVLIILTFVGEED